MKSPGARGFTLVELLVVLAVLSFMALAMAGSLRGMAQVGERIDARLDKAADTRAVAGFLRQILGFAIPLQRIDASETGSRRLFEGRPDSLAWVGLMPAGYADGGRHFFRLALEPLDTPQGQVSALTLRFTPAGQGSVFPDWSQAQVRVLLSDVDGLQFAYHDDRPGKPPVTDRWEDPTRLPRRVHMSLGPRSAWPDLVVAIRYPLGIGVAGAPDVTQAGPR